MEERLKQIQRSLDDLKRQQDDLVRKVDSIQKETDKIGKDLGSSDSKNMADSLYKLDNNFSRELENIRTMVREVQDTRRTTTSMELMLKEIMKGLSVIYNSVDELEENMLPERQSR